MSRRIRYDLMRMSAVAAAIPPPPPNAFITGSLAAARLTGVAPLYVNFDATGTTSTLSTNPTHELFYSWTFGDAGAGNWANGVQSAGLISKNAAFGPVTGHMYETPGTYTVILDAMDGVNTDTKTVTITVQDPNTVYAGTATICISSSGNFTGAPSGASQITVGSSDMYAPWNTYKASNNRVLFCKADSWVSSAAVSVNGLTGTFIGGYGTGAAHTFASGTLVSVTPASGIVSMFQGGGSTDCRICDFKISADATHFGTSASGIASVALTLYKIEVRGATAGFSSVTDGNGGTFITHDQHCIYECLNDQVYGYAAVPADTPRFTGATGAVGTPGIFTATGHKFNRFNKIILSGTAPAGLSTGTNYYVCAANLTANTFSLSLAQFPDTPLAITGVGTCDVTVISVSGGIGAFVALTRGGFMGCYLDSCNRGEQTLRMPYLNTAHVNNNYIARPNQTKNVLKIHCRGYDDISGVSSGFSEKIVVTSNVMDLRGGYSYNEAIPNNGQTATFVGYSEMVIGNGGTSPGGERVRNVIVQNNFTHVCAGNPKDSVSFIAANCPNMTVRNNIADFSMGNRTTAYTAPYPYTSMAFAAVTTSTPDQTVGVRIYNNTAYSNLANSEKANFVYVSAPTSISVTGATGTPGVFTTVSAASHGLSVNMRVRLMGTPPAPLVANIDYWVSATSFSATTYVLSATNGGADLTLSGNGSCQVTTNYQVDDVKIKNNLWYYPFHSNTQRNAVSLSLTAAPTNVVTSNNTDNGQTSLTSPNFVATPPVALTDWRPNTGSYAIKASGTPVVLRDFNNVSRYGGFDHLGAVLP